MWSKKVDPNNPLETVFCINLITSFARTFHLHNHINLENELAFKYMFGLL